MMIMKGHKLTLLLVILTILYSSFASATWYYDDMSNTSNYRWNMTDGISIDSSNDYFVFDNNAGTGNMWIEPAITFNELGTTPLTIMWRIYNNDTFQNYGYQGIGSYGTGAAGYNYKLVFHPNQRLYLEFNDTAFVEYTTTTSPWYPRNGTQDFLFIFYPDSATGGRLEFGYKNVTAYDSAFTKTGFANLHNNTLDDSRGGSWTKYFRWNPWVSLLNGSTGATYRFYSFATDGITPPFYTSYQRSVGARDIVNDRTILDFKINYNGTIYRTTNGTLYLNFENNSNAWEKYNVVVDGNSNGGYMTEQYLNYNFTLAESNSTFNISNGQVSFLILRNSDSVVMTTYEQTINNSNVSVPAMSKRMNVTSYNSVAGAGQEVIISTQGDTYRTKKYNFSMTANSSIGDVITLNPNYCNQSAYDTYSGEVLNTFWINYLGTIYRTTNSTTLIPKDTWTNCSQAIHSLTFDSSDNTGYFTETKSPVSILGTNFSLTNDRIEVIGSNALDQSTIPSISCLVNATTITSTGGVCYLNHTESTALLTISALGGYHTSTDIFALTGNLTYYRNVTLAKTMNFLIKREYDQTCFPFNTNDNMSMVVYCQGASQQFNVTQCDHNFTIGCSFDSILLSHTNGTFAYFRSLIPAYNDSIVNWYMLDLNKDVGVQVIINLLDYSGQYSSGIIRLKRYFGTNIAEIIEQNFDIEDSVNLYLLKHARYSVEICNNAGSCVSLGEIIGDVAEEKTLTIPNIAFYPTDSLLGNQITWQMNWTPNTRIYFNYNDTTHTTTMIEWLVYNGSNTSQLYYNNTIMTYDLYASYIIPAAYYNSTFLACFVAYQPTLGIIKDCSAFYDIGKPFGYWEGFTTGEMNKTKFWGALIFLFVIMFLFSPYSINAGLVTTNVFLFIFIKFNWLITGNPVKDYIILIICAALSGYYIIGTATKTGGTTA